jgi:hypothetical protein
MCARELITTHFLCQPSCPPPAGFMCAGASIGMPDLHRFAIGNMAAVDMDGQQAVVSPRGVGFDTNCGVSNTHDMATAVSHREVCCNGSCCLLHACT